MAGPRIGIVGIHGFGSLHVLHVRELEAQGLARLVGLADPLVAPIVRDGRTIDTSELPPIFPDAETLLANVELDILIIATPLHTHMPIARLGLDAGVDVLLEKPPVTNLADYEELVALSESTGRAVQVGFQSLGSRAIPEVLRLIGEGELGEITGIAAYGSWLRDLSYWKRARWAGRRELDGIPVLDGVLSNPLAHATMTALRIAGWERPDDIGSIEYDLYHANDIEADDTSSYRMTAGADVAYSGTLAGAFTLDGPTHDTPYVVVRGTEGEASLAYTEDVLTVTRGGESRTETFERDGLLENLIAHRADGTPLLSSLASTGAFVRFVEEMGRTPVADIAPEHVEWRGEGDARHPVVPGIERAVVDSARDARLFREAGYAWTATA